MIKKIYCVFLVLVLTACGTVPPDPIVVKEAKEVDVPIVAPCKTDKPAEPAWALSGIAADADVFVKARAAVAEIGQRIAYEGLLIAAVGACQ